MSRAGALDRIAAILAAVTTPTFQIVLRSEPLSIPSGERIVAFWYEGEREKSKTLGDVAVTEAIAIRAYWRVQPAQQARDALELEVWNATRAIQSGIRADSDLGGNVTDLEIGLAVTGWAEVGNATYRVVTIPLDLWVYESEAISP